MSQRYPEPLEVGPIVAAPPQFARWDRLYLVLTVLLHWLAPLLCLPAFAAGRPPLDYASARPATPVRGRKRGLRRVSPVAVRSPPVVRFGGRFDPDGARWTFAAPVPGRTPSVRTA